MDKSVDKINFCLNRKNLFKINVENIYLILYNDI